MCRRIHSGIVRLDSQRMSQSPAGGAGAAKGARALGGAQPLPASSPVELTARATVRGARALAAVAPSWLMRALIVRHWNKVSRELLDPLIVGL